MPQSLAVLRRQFPHTRRGVYFDHASSTPIPRRARELVAEFCAKMQSLDRRIDAESFAILPQIKRDFARLIGARARDISWQPNTTSGIMQVLLGLDFCPGERILLPEVEFPALVYAVQSMARRRRLKVDFLPCPGGHYAIDDLDRYFSRHQTAVLATSWVQYFDGYRYVAAELAEVCHRHGVFLLLDAIQGVGVVPLNIRKAGVDALACGGQKWLISLMGSGFLYVNPEPIRPLEPAIIGWLGVDWQMKYGNLQLHDRLPCSDGRRFDGGTYPYLSLRTAKVGLELLNASGVRRTYNQINSLLDDLELFLQETPYTLVVDRSPRHNSGILSFAGPGAKSLHKHLLINGFRVSFREGNIRVSPHFYNTRQEMQRFIRAIRTFDRKQQGKL